jgi:tRNA(fMet)-specific endonuclease VapC
MESRYLLDTNIASYIIKGNNPAVDRRVVKVPVEQLAISAVTEGELRFGAARLPHATRLHALVEDFFLRVAVLAWDSDAARHYGQLRATLERQVRKDQKAETRRLVETAAAMSFHHPHPR